MDERKELSRGEQLRKALTYQKKNGYDRLQPGELEAMEAYCAGYKQFLDAGKTERECVDRTIALAEGEDKEELLAGFEERCASLQDGSWKQGWHEFCLSKKEVYETVLQNVCKPGATERENANFAHYLDCEAHTDVWRELFPTYNQTNERD